MPSLQNTRGHLSLDSPERFGNLHFRRGELQFTGRGGLVQDMENHVPPGEQEKTL
jgi:hypothetical protein